MATNDLLTLAEAKTALNLEASATTHDTELALWITAVSTRIDKLCAPVVIRTVTDETHDGGRSCIRLRKAPVSEASATTVTSVSEYDQTTLTALTAETNGSKPAQAFAFDQVLGLLYRRSSGSDASFVSGRGNVLVTYQAGRYSATATVDALFKLAAGAILRRLWQREQGAWATGGDPFVESTGSGFFNAVDPMVKELLGDELLPPGLA